ncbi:hypothetical protein [Flaviflexus equikiangi]|uniref:Uncharacterized protein n=1 Tax=Flaviflexus equikiangi TaxID=2758573 RepID=A0ABS2TCI7_9ACTO|nr:hypothetical protein [Flaviflexus equikiangi]MBM9432365.1 hypothetical protein [Flaviflexus equikiangi]
MTAMNPFATIPSPSDGITWADVNGALLIIRPTSIEAGIQTSFGAADAVRADVWVVDGPSAGEFHDDTLVFPKLLQSQLKSRINQVVLGRLTQGQGKPGQSAPWLLAEPTAQDVQVGMQAWERIQAGGQPSPTQQAPVRQMPVQQAPQPTTLQPQAQAQAGWGQPQAQPGWGQPDQQAPVADTTPPF